MLDCKVLKSLNNFREKWIGNFRDHKAEDAALSRNQRACLGVRIVAQFIDHPPYPFGELRINRGNMVDSS